MLRQPAKESTESEEYVLDRRPVIVEFREFLQDKVQQEFCHRGRLCQWPAVEKDPVTFLRGKFSMQFKQGAPYGCACRLSLRMAYWDARGIADPPMQAVEPRSRQIKAGWQKRLAVD